jgi:hypothetical protein
MQEAAPEAACAGRQLGFCGGRCDFTLANWESHFSFVSTV